MGEFTHAQAIIDRLRTENEALHKRVECAEADYAKFINVHNAYVDAAIAKIKEAEAKRDEWKRLYGAADTRTEDLDAKWDAALARAEQAEARAAELEDRGPGTLYARIEGICRFAQDRGLCTGTEAKPGELFLIEGYDAAIARAEQAEARVAVLDEAFNKLMLRTDKATDRICELNDQLATAREALEKIGHGGPFTQFHPSVDTARAALAQISPAAAQP